MEIVVRTFSAREKVAFLIVSGIVCVSTLVVLWNISGIFLEEVPARGGSLSEGVIGTPRFINPLLALSDADRDLTQLIYSGLMRATASGTLIPDLAEQYEISPDGLVYTFTLKEDLTWHDRKPITSDDVVFTINRIKDSSLRSPKRASWEGVTVEKVDERTMRFVLPQSYSPFLENTTLGILPKHVWENISSDQFSFSMLNVEPIGSGPYKIRAIKKNQSGIPEYYDLVPFNNFALGRPYINNIRMRFYANSETALLAFEGGDTGAAATVSPERAAAFSERGRRVITYTLPRVFGVFLNQNQNPIFTEKAVREALYASIDRDRVVQDILNGYGTPLYGPLPPGSLGFAYEPLPSDTTLPPAERAEALLEKAGWKKDAETGIRQKTISKKNIRVLEFSITTSEADELKEVASALKESWEKIGARIDIKIFKASDLNQNVIRSRKYDALFFGEIIGRESDPFAFWHSSQRNDPGLNIALYANITADKLLEQGRIASDVHDREKIYQQFEEEVRNDTPFIPLYSPDFIYIVPANIRGITSGTITTPSERFLDVYAWHTRTDRVWKIFNKKE